MILSCHLEPFSTPVVDKVSLLEALEYIFFAFGTACALTGDGAGAAFALIGREAAFAFAGAGKAFLTFRLAGSFFVSHFAEPESFGFDEVFGFGAELVFDVFGFGAEFVFDVFGLGAAFVELLFEGAFLTFFTVSVFSVLEDVAFFAGAGLVT